MGWWPNTRAAREDAVGLLFYLYLSATIVLAGAEMNAAIHRSPTDGTIRAEKSALDHEISTTRVEGPEMLETAARSGPDAASALARAIGACARDGIHARIRGHSDGAHRNRNLAEERMERSARTNGNRLHASNL